MRIDHDQSNVIQPLQVGVSNVRWAELLSSK